MCEEEVIQIKALDPFSLPFLLAKRHIRARHMWLRCLEWEWLVGRYSVVSMAFLAYLRGIVRLLQSVCMKKLEIGTSI